MFVLVSIDETLEDNELENKFNAVLGTSHSKEILEKEKARLINTKTSDEQIPNLKIVKVPLFL